MSGGPLISIVLPTYNGERYLAQALDSCLQQSFTDWELILVDDASTDATPILMRQYAARDGRIQVFRNATNSKLPKSLNHGFAQARGEFLTWTSDDNCYRPQALVTMLNFLRNHPDIDIVYANYSVIDENGTPKRTGPPGAGPLEELPLRNVVGACFLYRRAVHEQLGGYAEDLFLVEDYDFWLRASTRFRLAFLDEDLYLYRWHSQSLSLQKTGEIRLAHEQALARNLGRMHWLPRPAWTRAWQEVIGRAIDCGDRAAARSYLRQSLRRDPFIPFRLGLPPLVSLFFPVWVNRCVQGLEARRRRRRLQHALQEIRQLIPSGATFILVDEEQLRSEVTFACALPYVEHEGEWWGPPEEDVSAIAEFERLRQAGAAFIVFAWPAFWWLDHYQGLRQHLHSQFRCTWKDENLVVYDLRGGPCPHCATTR